MIESEVLPSAPNNILQLAVLESQPTPVLVLSATGRIVLLNKACQTLFPTHSSWLSRSLNDLPIQWQDGEDENLRNLVIGSVDGVNGFVDDEQSASIDDVLKLEIDILNTLSPAIFSARLLVTSVVIAHDRYRVLSFENVKEVTGIHLAPLEAKPTPSEDRRPSSRTTSNKIGSSRPGVVSKESTDTGISIIDSKFALLKDAIYYNNRDRAGFLLSADETFCYPNYNGTPNVLPVEIDDIELFLKDWDVWDLNFTRQLPISEYPSIWLNEHQTRFRRRYGIKENGKDLVLEANGEPLFDVTTGEYLGGVVWLTHLGEYDQFMASELKATLSDFRNICDRLPHLLWTMDPDGQADYFSQSWFDFTGLSQSDLLGRGFESVIDSGDMERIWDEVEAHAGLRTEFQAEARYLRHDGEWVWMSVRGKPLYDRCGTMLKWYGSSTPIHDLVVKRIQAERQRSQMVDMLCLADIGLFEVTASGYLNVLEGRVNWLEDQSISNVTKSLAGLQTNGVPTLLTNLQQIMDNGRESSVFEEKIRSRWYKFRLLADKDEGSLASRPSRILGCCIDITEQHERATLEADNTRLIAEASMEMESNRLKTAFLARMSHEIRTPVAGIIGIADMLAEETLTKEQRDMVGDIQISSSTLLVIVNDILDLSRIEAGEMKFEKSLFDIHALVGEVVKFFRRMLHRTSVRLTCQQNLSYHGEMMGDPGRVKQILTNLLSNAVKFTAHGSIAVTVLISEREIKISVEDTGEGIDEHTMRRLFKPFVQGDASTARRHGGTGLGLTISKELAERMGGTLSLESIPSVGTKAILTLPIGVDHQDLSARKEVSQTPEMLALRNKVPLPPKDIVLPPSEHLILVAEDNAINQKVIKNQVEKLGYQTKIVWNGQEALDYLASNALPSLILMDCQMPLMDGYEATRQLRSNPKYEAAKKIPVVALTASAIIGDKEKCQAAGMDGYLSKPVPKSLLKETLSKWIPSTIDGE